MTGLEKIKSRYEKRKAQGKTNLPFKDWLREISFTLCPHELNLCNAPSGNECRTMICEDCWQKALESEVQS